MPLGLVAVFPFVCLGKKRWGKIPFDCDQRLGFLFPCLVMEMKEMIEEMLRIDCCGILLKSVLMKKTIEKKGESVWRADIGVVVVVCDQRKKIDIPRFQV